MKQSTINEKSFFLKCLMHETTG